MATMRAVDVQGGRGPASSLYISSTIPKPTPKPGECLIKIKAFGLNRADTLQREGKYPVPPGVTKIMGLEFSGVVEEVGSDPSGDEWKVGDEVFGLTYGGAYAEFVAVSKKMLVRKPVELSWVECAAVPEVWMTALQAIHLVGEYDPKTAKSILWHAGASAVSIAGLQLSLALSDPPPRVYATTRQDAKCDFVNQIGAHAAVNTTKSYTKADDSPDGTWVDEIRRINNGEGIDLIIDFIGAPYFAPNLSLLAQDGRLVLLGAMGGMTIPCEVDISPILMKRTTVVGSTLRSRDAEYQGRLRDLFVEKVLPGLVSGEFRVVVERVCSWRDVGMAHGLLEGNETRGKVVCLVD